MALPLYLARDGSRITKEDWTEKRADATYSVLGEYDNGQVYAKLDWLGRIPKPDEVFPDYYKLFRFTVSNYTADGSKVRDPVEGEVFFAYETAALAHYQEFLAKWTACEIEASGAFVEADNALIPPPPPDPNKPASEPEAPELGGVGAW